MNKRESIRALIRHKMHTLEQAQPTMAAVYAGMFDRPQAIACETNDGCNITQLSYAEMDRRITAFAAALRQKIGALHTYIAIAMENGPDFITAFWGVLRSGNKPYLVNLRQPFSMQTQALAQLEVQYILATAPGKLPGEYLLFADLSDTNTASYAAESGTFIQQDSAAFENEFALSSSGTGGAPAVCIYDGACVLAQLRDARKILQKNHRMQQHANGALKQLAFLSFYHVFGLFAVYFWFSYFSRTIVFVRDLSPAVLCGTAQLHGVSHIFAVPLLWHETERLFLRQLHQMPPAQQKNFWRIHSFSLWLQQLFPYAGATVARMLFRSVNNRLFGNTVRFCISGGSYIRPSALRLFNGLGYPLHNGYGLTEAGITSVELTARPKRRLCGAVGMPFASVHYSIAKDGTLTVQGDAVCREILHDGMRMQTNKSIQTGDIAYFDGKGYFIRGRQCDTVITESGENISPDAIEPLFALPDACALSLLGLGEDSAEQLTLVVQISPYLPPTRLEALRQTILQINHALPLPQQARALFYTTDPLLPPQAIKVNRRALRQGIQQGTIRLTPFTAPSVPPTDTFDPDSPLACRVRQILAQALEIEETKITPDAQLFTDLGASSLQYFAAVSALSEAFSLQSFDQTEQYCYTLRQLCDYLAKHL